jgi:hypothetical protein
MTRGQQYTRGFQILLPPQGDRERDDSMLRRINVEDEKRMMKSYTVNPKPTSLPQASQHKEAYEG